MEHMRNLLRTSATGDSGSELSTPRSSLSSHRATPSFNDLSFNAASDAEAGYAEQQPTSLRTISQPSFGRHSAEAAMTSRPTGLARLSAALATSGKAASEAPYRAQQSAPQDIPGQVKSTSSSPKSRWQEGKIHGLDMYDYHSLHNDLVRGTSL